MADLQGIEIKSGQKNGKKLRNNNLYFIWGIQTYLKGIEREAV